MKVAYTVTPPGPSAHRVAAWGAPLEESLPRLSELGYDGVELMPDQTDLAHADAISRLADRCRLQIAAVGTGLLNMGHGLSLSSEDDSVRAAAVEAAGAYLAFCESIGATNLTIGALRGRCESGQVEPARARLVDSLRRLTDVAEQHGVLLCLEPQNRFQCSFLRTVEETVPLLDAVGSRALGLSLDSFHMNIEEASLEGACRAANGRTHYVQLADNHRGAPGTGMFPFDRLFRSLAGIGYGGWFCLELDQGPDPAKQAQAGLFGFRTLLRTGASR